VKRTNLLHALVESMLARLPGPPKGPTREGPLLGAYRPFKGSRLKGSKGSMLPFRRALS
jgi:hypothetical protein